MSADEDEAPVLELDEDIDTVPQTEQNDETTEQVDEPGKNPNLEQQTQPEMDYSEFLDNPFAEDAFVPDFDLAAQDIIVDSPIAVVDDKKNGEKKPEGKENEASESPGQKLASEPSKTTLFIHGFDWWVTDREIEDMFGAYGSVQEVRIFSEKLNGKSAGSGLVLYGSAAAAKSAVESFSNNDGDFKIHGRQIQVSFYTPQVRRTSGGMIMMPPAVTGAQQPWMPMMMGPPQGYFRGMPMPMRRPAYNTMNGQYGGAPVQPSVSKSKASESESDSKRSKPRDDKVRSRSRGRDKDKSSENSRKRSRSAKRTPSTRSRSRRRSRSPKRRRSRSRGSGASPTRARSRTSPARRSRTPPRRRSRTPPRRSSPPRRRRSPPTPPRRRRSRSRSRDRNRTSRRR